MRIVLRTSGFVQVPSGDRSPFRTQLPSYRQSARSLPPGKELRFFALKITRAKGDAISAGGRELPCNPVFTDFLTSELLPSAHGLYNFTTDPRQAAVGGSSFGGLAATRADLRHPETFGNILSQSDSYVWNPLKSDLEAQTTWHAFLKTHWDAVAAIDFTTEEYLDRMILFRSTYFL